jgi:hypothetical protein
MRGPTGSKLVRAACLWISVTSPCVLHGQAAGTPDTTFSGIVEYVFAPNPNPREIQPRMYNWEVRLSAADSRKGPYEIVQLTRALTAAGKAPQPEMSVLVDAGMIVANQDGVIPFELRVGDKEPTRNMGRQGNIGQPVVFSGKGTGKGASGWIVLPGTRVERVTPSSKGTRLSNGRLEFIQFIVTNDRGEKFQADVVLRRGSARGS